jgi:hypothetical protein
MKSVTARAALLALAIFPMGDAHAAPTRRKVTPQSQSVKEVVAVGRAKADFILIRNSCENPKDCDQGLLTTAEKGFMEACQVCAPLEKCEADRDAIRNGNGKRSYNPCVPARDK